MQILLPKDARSTDILPDSGQTKDPAMWTGISLEHVSAQYICILYINKYIYIYIHDYIYIYIIIKGSLGGETSVLRTFRMSGKELVKERVSKEKELVRERVSQRKS